MNARSIPHFVLLAVLLSQCSPREKGEQIPTVSPFDDDIAFLTQYGQVIELTAPDGKGRVAVMPALQARVMTSTSGPPQNLSYGWINRSYFEAGDTSVHINPFGGEERLWLGPEGGQYSIFYPPDSAFTFENWHTPRLIDLDNWDVSGQTEHSASFTKSATLTNYSRTEFNIALHREVRVLSTDQAFELLGVQGDTSVSCVAYQTSNYLENAGTTPWRKQTGLLSIWLLGMFNPSPEVTMVIPYVPGPVQALGPAVNDEYFGKVPADRLKVADSVIYFRGDGQHRSKIGLTPGRARDVLGSYDPATGTLTIVKYSKGEPDDVYVNSKWEIQKDPYNGDVVNAYNDGPRPGAKPLGPFYELESSSPARELEPGTGIRHVQTTFHFQGSETALDPLAKSVLGVSIAEIKAAF